MAKKKASSSRGRKARPPLKASARKVSRGATRARAAGRKAARSAGKTASRRAAKPASRRAASAKTAGRRAASNKTAARKAVKKTRLAAAGAKAAATRQARAATKEVARLVGKTTPAARKKPNLDRPRKTVADIRGLPSSLEPGGASAARTGRAEFEQKLHQHTSTSPALTAGDLDADWESADSTGDEAPGGDNPTPDQDVVDEIGRALGVEYDDDEELQGGDEIAARDRHRWELDPESREDFDEER
jgi:hypothetical protein